MGLKGFCKHRSCPGILLPLIGFQQGWGKSRFHRWLDECTSFIVLRRVLFKPRNGRSIFEMSTECGFCHLTACAEFGQSGLFHGAVLVCLDRLRPTPGRQNSKALPLEHKLLLPFTCLCCELLAPWRLSNHAPNPCLSGETRVARTKAWEMGRHCLGNEYGRYSLRSS